MSTNLHDDVDAARRITAFLEDPAVKGALVDLEKRYFKQFKESKTSAERDAIHAKSQALQELFSSCLGIKDNGEVAQRTIERQQQTAEREAQHQRRTPRR